MPKTAIDPTARVEGTYVDLPEIPVQLDLAFTERGFAMLELMLRAGGFTTLEDLVMVALHRYARFLQVGDVPGDLFDFTLRLKRLGLLQHRDTHGEVS